MYYIYEESNGRLHSTTPNDDFIDGLRSGYKYVELPKSDGIWNQITLSFDERPAETKMLKSSFYKRLGITLIHKIKIAARTDDLIGAYMELVSGLDVIDTASTDFTVGVNYLVSEGILTQGEVDGLLSTK